MIAHFSLVMRPATMVLTLQDLVGVLVVVLRHVMSAELPCKAAIS